MDEAHIASDQPVGQFPVAAIVSQRRSQRFCHGCGPSRQPHPPGRLRQDHAFLLLLAGVINTQLPCANQLHVQEIHQQGAQRLDTNTNSRTPPA